MKKIFKYLLMVALVGGLSLTLVSCSDDDNESQASEITIGNDLKAHGVETDMQSAVIEVPVKCNGEWTVTIPSNIDWVRVLDWQVIFRGDQTLRLAFDENRTGADRNTTLNLGNSEGDVQKVILRQFYNFEGQAPTNGSGQAFADQGLGCGIDYDYVLNMKGIAARYDQETALIEKKEMKESERTKFEPTKVHKLDNIYNISAIQQLQKRGTNPLQKSAYVESEIQLAQLEAQLMDSSFAQKKHLDISLTIGVEFGPVSFNAHGSYNSTKKEERAKVDYTINRYCPMYNVYLSPAEISTFATDPKNNKMDLDADDAAIAEIEQLEARYVKINKRKKNLVLNDNGLTEEQQEEIDNMWDMIPVIYDYAGVFSANFTKIYNKLYNTIARPRIRGKEVDREAANQILNQLDNNFGPFFIAGGDYGGALTMHCKIDTTYLDGETTFGGELEGSVAGACDVEGKFNYTETGITLLRNSNTNIYIYGGSANLTADNMMAVILGGNATDWAKWQDMMKEWIASMWSPTGNEPDQSKAAPISFTVAPIWTVFENEYIQQYAQDYFMAKYADRNIEKYFGMMQGTYKPSIDDILDLESNFYKK